MTLFVDISTRLLCHMNPINIIMETYMQVMQKMFKINNYLFFTLFFIIYFNPTWKYCIGCKKTNNYYETYMRVLQWL